MSGIASAGRAPLPPAAELPLLRGALRQVRDLWAWRHLVRAFVIYEIKHDKRNHLLGNLWHLLNPVLNMLIFMFVFAVIFRGREPMYALHYFCGSMFFRLWTIALGRGTSALTSQAGMIRSCYFPRIVLVAPVTLVNLYGFLVETVVLVLLLALYRVMPGWPVLLVLPLVLVTVVGSTGAVLLLSCLGVRFRDLTNLVQHFNRMLFYFSPVMYPLSFVPERFRDLYMLNPVSGAVEMARDVIIRGEIPAAGLALYYSAFCLGLLALGLLVFTALQGRIAKHL